MDERERVQNLLRDALQSRHIEVELFLDLPVVLGVLVKVVSQKLRHNKQVLLVIKEVNKLEQVLRVKILTVCVDVAQQLDLVNRLVEVVLVVLDDLHAHHLLRMNVVALDSLRKGCTSKVLDNLIATSYNAVDDDREVFCLFKARFFAIKDHTQVVTVVDHAVELSRVELIVGRHELDPARQHRHLPTIVIIELFLLRLFVLGLGR